MLNGIEKSRRGWTTETLARGLWPSTGIWSGVWVVGLGARRVAMYTLPTVRPVSGVHLATVSSGEKGMIQGTVVSHDSETPTTYSLDTGARAG